MRAKCAHEFQVNEAAVGFLSGFNEYINLNLNVCALIQKIYYQK